MANGRKTGGRVKGTPNRFNATLKDMILGALSDAGGQAYLTRCALEAPAPFLALLGRVLPSQQEHSGSVTMGGEAIDRPPPGRRPGWRGASSTSRPDRAATVHLAARHPNSASAPGKYYPLPST